MNGSTVTVRKPRLRRTVFARIDEDSYLRLQDRAAELDRPASWVMREALKRELNGERPVST